MYVSIWKAGAFLPTQPSERRLAEQPTQNRASSKYKKCFIFASIFNKDS